MVDKIDEDTDKKYWRVKLLIGIKTYGEGKTEEDAIQYAIAKFMTIPEVEERVYHFQLVKAKASEPMTYTKMMKDNVKKW